MNFTIRTIVSRLRQSIREVSSDSNLSNRYLWNVFFTKYLKILKQNKNLMNLDIFTTIDLEPEYVEEGCTDCTTCRVKLDDAVIFKKGIVKKYITTPDFSGNFNLTSPKLFSLKKDNGFLYSYYQGGYLYFNKCYPCIKISYLSMFGESNDCSTLNNKLNIPSFLIDDSVTAALQEIMVVNKLTDVTDNKTETS